MREDRQKKVIARTILPNLSNEVEQLNSEDLKYFYRIKRNLRLQDWQREKETNTKTKQRRDNHRSISPRLMLLAKAKPVPQNHSTMAPRTARSFYLRPICPKKEMNFDEKYFNQNHFFFVKQDGFEYTDEDNLGKNINGTALGVFSEQLISQKLENSRAKDAQKQTHKPVLTRQLDSDNEAVEVKQPQLKKDNKRIRKLSLISRTSSIASTNKAENKLLDLIYGDEQFLQKYKSQQMALMEKNSVYKERKLTLDYKNQWKI